MNTDQTKLHFYILCRRLAKTLTTQPNDMERVNTTLNQIVAAVKHEDEHSIKSEIVVDLVPKLV